MYLAMDSWADYTETLEDSESHPFIVLDRPTTTNAHTLEGPILEPEWQTFIGVGQIPNRYAMTIGELAQLFKGEADVMDGARYHRSDADDSYVNVSDIELVVVPMTGYDRTKTYDELFDQDAFIPTSPNIPTVDAALHYIGTGLMDGTILQEIVPNYDEKGYTQFEYIRLPFIQDQDDMVTFLEHAADTYDFPGVVLRTEEDPQTEQTNIIHLDVYNTTDYNPTYTAMALIYTAATHYPDEEIFYSEQGKRVFNKGIGNDWFSQMLEDPNRPSFQDILEDIRYEVYDFNEIREHYLLYD
jgi:beta-N-acetylhexosaminidase